MSDVENDNDVVADYDTCSVEELENTFRTTYSLASEEAISLKKNYILHLDHSNGFDRIAAATSDQSVLVYDLRNNTGVVQLNQLNVDAISKNIQNTEICGVKFANTESNLVFVGTTNGKFYAFDLRSPEKVAFDFECDEKSKKPITCFDLNSNDSIVCAGTEQTASEAYLLYFDVRKKTPLGAYIDSHEDDITQVKFHPNQHNLLASGSTDGLINVFDINKTSEDDALEYCLNTENSVQTINWHRKPNDIAEDRNALSCITHTNDFHLYDVEESESILTQNRNDITDLVKRKSVEECYLINCHNTANDNGMFLLVGSNFNNGECLRSLTLDKDNGCFKPMTNFLKNKQIVRCSIFNAKDEVLITAGEGGIVTVWQAKLDIKPHSDKLKETTKSKDRKVKPY